MPDETPLRIGILGAARIAPMALVRPARQVPEARLTAVAARDESRARAFADKHGIPRTHRDYDALLADPEIDAVYNPLPNSLHCDWTVRALEAGKHVLCEKPLASNAEEAVRMTDAAEKAGRILFEAFHWRYHPLAERMREIATGTSLGKIRHVEAHMCIPLPIPGDIRYRYDLAGGATMDVGCYAISMLRFLAGAEPRVVGARALLSSPDVDRSMSVDFEFEDGRTGRITCSLLSAALFRIRAAVIGSDGEMRVLNPVAPHIFHRLTLRTPRGRTSERVAGEATYTHQLRAFVRSVRTGASPPTDGRHGIANMRVIDAVYRKAGLRPRAPHAP